MKKNIQGKFKYSIALSLVNNTYNENRNYDVTILQPGMRELMAFLASIIGK